MKESRRANRMQRHHARRRGSGALLDMVSLMDIFTILVFFLLVSSANSDILPTPKNIKLPRSTAEQIPKENIVIILGDNNILIQGKKVASIKSAAEGDNNVIMPLFNELKHLAASKKKKPGQTSVTDEGVTIMGDKEIPYIVLKRIMLTCASANYSNISLAVSRKAIEKS
ncbi:MAG: biopolymer transporter ExbD [Gammaproteobacteria bacterium]|jgi:biopolymer transport protein TolR|nr:biopolymer transporter ExbD [Gammaproteobacteria bacterium]